MRAMLLQYPPPLYIYMCVCVCGAYFNHSYQTPLPESQHRPAAVIQLCTFILPPSHHYIHIHTTHTHTHMYVCICIYIYIIYIHPVIFTLPNSIPPSVKIEYVFLPGTFGPILPHRTLSPPLPLSRFASLSRFLQIVLSRSFSFAPSFFSSEFDFHVFLNFRFSRWLAFFVFPNSRFLSFSLCRFFRLRVLSTFTISSFSQIMVFGFSSFLVYRNL